MTLRPPVRVVGCGSPCGDDRVGWAVVGAIREALAGSRVDVELHTTATPDRLLDVLDGRGSLVIVDALVASAPAGRVLRFEWPDARLQPHTGASTHGLSVPTILALAASMQRLPARVVVYGIACRRPGSRATLTRAVKASVAAVVHAILAEIGIRWPRQRGAFPDRP